MTTVTAKTDMVKHISRYTDDEDDSSRRAQKLVDDVKSGKLGRGSRGRGQKPRGGKQIDIGLESDKGSLDSTANR